MEEQKTVVNTEPVTTAPVSEDPKPQVQEPEKVIEPAGSKTDSNLLLKSLQEEREKRRILEEEKKLLEEKVSTLITPTEEELYSDEGKALGKKISILEEKLISIEEEKNLAVLFNQFPLLKEKTEEFKQFRQSEHPRAKLESVAKLYLAENGLLEPTRKGLEKSTGGTRTPLTSGMTTEDVATLRKTNFKKYQQLLMEGKLKFD